MTERDTIRIIERDDPDLYPQLIEAWPGAIPALFVRGAWPVTAPAIAIIGSTKPAPEARAWAFRLARESALRGWVVVSGLARGVDAAAHEGALAGGGVTIAVVANGLDSVYPAEHADLARRIVAQGGALLSLAPPGTAAIRERLLQRNQLTSGLSQVVVTVQSRGRDGAMATMRHAARQGRLLAAFTPPVNDDAWDGNRLLLSENAPWREAALTWRSALAIDATADPDEFFATVTDALDRLDEQRHLRETPGVTQPRLLESSGTNGV